MTSAPPALGESSSGWRDKLWGDPVGIVFTAYGMVRARVRVSMMFFLLVLTSILAIVTPLILANTYRIETFLVDIPIRDFRPYTATPDRMRALECYNQFAAGSGSWSTGQSVESMFNASTYIPVNPAREDGGNDLFFAGDVQRLATKLPGVRHYGGCLGHDDPGTHPETSYKQFLATCDQAGFTIATNRIHRSIWTAKAAYQWCGRYDLFSDHLQYDSGNASTTSTSLAWFRIQNGTHADNPTTLMLTQGIIQCTSTLQFGWADVNGTDMTMSNFIAQPLFNSTQAGHHAFKPMVHPVTAAMGILNNPGRSNTPSEYGQKRAWMTKLGFNQTISVTLNKGLSMNQPTIADLAQRLWIGTTHMANSIDLLSMSRDQSFDAIQHTTVTGYARSNLFFMLTVSLLGMWGAFMIGLTLLLWRPTFASSLCSYSAARLLADRPDLVEDFRCGDTDANPKLNEAFGRVGDSVSDSFLIGHISASSR